MDANQQKDIVLNAVGKVLEDNMGNRVTVALANGILVHASRVVDEWLERQAQQPKLEVAVQPPEAAGDVASE
jgi:hypothetical protein